jgi:hypothetical protein
LLVDAAVWVVIMEALHRGSEEKMDILVLSLYGLNGWSSSSAAVVAERIAKDGTIVIGAAGDLGDGGPWMTSSPGDATGVLSIGSVEKSVFESSFVGHLLIMCFFCKLDHAHQKRDS